LAEQLAAACSPEQQPFTTQQPPASQQAGQLQVSPQHAAQSTQQLQPAAPELAVAVSDRPPRPRAVTTAANDRKRDMESLQEF